LFTNINLIDICYPDFYFPSLIMVVDYLLTLSPTILIVVILLNCQLVIDAQYQQQQQGHVHPQQQQFQQAAGYQQQQFHQQQQQHHPQQGYGHPQQAHGQVPHHQQPPAQGQNLLHDKSRIQDKHHLKEHLGGVVSEPDLSKMTEEELQFHYFKMHDNDNNNKLDGSELIKSLIHWHVEESKHMGANAPPQGTTKIFQDQELATMIDPILEMDDRNRDGFIDYPEFVAAQKSRGF